MKRLLIALYASYLKNISPVLLILCLMYTQSSSDEGENQINNMTNNHLNNQIDQIGKGSVGCTGDMSFSIPLMTIPGRGDLDFKLVANYKAGIRVDQEASIIGLGWHLEIGEISRIIRYYHDRFNDKPQGHVGNDIPDAFSMSTPFGSLKFSNFQNDVGDGLRPFSNPIYYPDNWEPWKIEVFQRSFNPLETSFEIEKFIITNSQGTKFIFDRPLERQSLSCTPYYEEVQGIESGNYKWLLTAVLSSDYVDANGNNDPLDCTHPAIDNGGSWIAIVYKFDTDPDKTFHYQYPQYLNPCSLEVTYPYRVVTPTHVAEFSYSSDPPTGNSYQSLYEVSSGPGNPAHEKQKRISSITLYAYSGIGSEPNYQQSWFQKSIFTYKDAGELAWPLGGESTFGKSTLEKLEIRGQDVSEKYVYKFDYNFNPPINYGPEGIHNCTDHWNYYNLINNPGEENFCATAWSLTKLSLPTGGWIEYEYENDRWFNEEVKKEGGIRLTSKTIYDGMNSSPATYTYSYGSTTDHYGYLTSKPGEMIREENQNEGSEDIFIFMDNAADHYITYDVVTETLPDGSSIKRFYTSTKDELINEDGELPIVMSWSGNRFYFKISYGGSWAYQRGILTKEEYYKPGGITKVKEVTYTYSDYDYNNKGSVQHEIVNYVHCPNTANPVCISAWVKLNSVTTYDYDQYGNNPIIKSVEYEYNDENREVKKITETNSNNEQRIKETFFAYGSLSSGMGLKNMLSQIASIGVENEVNYYYSKDYTDWGLEGGQYRIQDKWKWKSDQPSPNVGKDLHFFQNPSYDNYGNLIQVEDVKSIVMTTKWGHNYSVPIATIVNATNAECFVEDFNDLDIDDGQPADWWYQTPTNWVVEDGNLYWTVAGTTTGMCGNPQSIDLNSFIAEFDVQIVDGNTTIDWGGFQFRKTDYTHFVASSGYLVNVRENNELTLYYRNNGIGYILGTNQLIATSTNWHHIRVLAVGSNIKIFADGKLAINVTNSVHNGSYYGFEVYHAKTKFDNLRIYPSDALCTSQAYDCVSLDKISETDENGTTTYFEYDGLGRLISTSNNDFQVLSEYDYYYPWDGGDNFNPADPNYILEKTYRTTTDNSTIKNYADGLGRKIQTQSQNGTEDINTTIDYDLFGRAIKNWKPYICTSGHLYEDEYDESSSNPKSAKYYYNGTNGRPDCGQYPYSANTYKDAFSNLSLIEAFPGEVFSIGSDHTKMHYYLANVTDEVQNYQAHTLYKEKLIDENENTITNFKDKFDNVIMNLHDQVTAPGDSISEYIDCSGGQGGKKVKPFVVEFDHFVQYGFRLWMENNDGWCYFRILKDGQEIIEHSLSYQGEVEINDLEFMALQGHNYQFEVQVTSCQAGAKSSFGYVKTLDLIQDLTRTTFEYDILGNLLNTTNPSDQVSQYQYNTIGQLIYKATPDLDGEGDGNPLDETLSIPDEKYKYDENGNLRFVQDPNRQAGGKDILFYQYDIFNRKTASGCATDDGILPSWDGLLPDILNNFENYSLHPEYFNTQYFYDLPSDLHPEAQNLHGRLSWIKYKTGSNWSYTFYSYNSQGFMEWQINKIDVNGILEKKIEYEYDLGGEITKIVFARGNPFEQVCSWYDYDNLGRLYKVFTNTDADVKPTLADAIYEYWPTGHVKSLKLSEKAGQQYAEILNYEYTERDWLQNINAPAGIEQLVPTQFAENIHYYDLPSNPRYNGDISAVDYHIDRPDAVPQNPSGTKAHRYVVNYDNLSRMTAADFYYFDITGVWNNSGSYYDVSNLFYDHIGNIQTLTRKDANGAGNPFTYHYKNSNTNWLEWVEGYNSQAAGNYTYDPNGNLKLDNKRNITSTLFDHRNLPMKILYTNGDYIEFFYDDAGNRMHKYYRYNNGVSSSGKYYVNDKDGRTIAVYDLNKNLLFVNLYGLDLIGYISY